METSILSYEDFLQEDEEIYKFECDMEQGNYKQWIEKYPQHTLSIFGALLSFNGSRLTEEDIVYFMNKEIELNVPSKAYHSEFESTTLLVFACEHRHIELAEHLLKLGADVNQRDPNNISPFESGLMGHGASCIYDSEQVESLVKLLMKYGMKKEIKGNVLEDYCEHYLEKSEYLSTLLNSCIQIE